MPAPIVLSRKPLIKEVMYPWKTTTPHSPTISAESVISVRRFWRRMFRQAIAIVFMLRSRLR